MNAMKKNITDMKKDRKIHLLSLTCCRILTANALLTFLPVFLYSCEAAKVHEQDEPSVSIQIERTQSRNMQECINLDIFIFNDDRLQRLDSYQRVIPSSMEKITAASRKGKKIIAVIANSKFEKEEWSGINSLDALYATAAELQKEDPAKPVMCGTTYVEMGTDAACSIDMWPLISEIYIRSVRCDFSGKPYSGEELQNVRVYLPNVNARAPLFRKSGFMPQQITNSGRLSENDLASFSHPGMLMRQLDSPVGNETSYPEISLYCYPNDCIEESPGSPFTRLVIEGELSGHIYYYPININRNMESGSGTGIGRNSRYAYDITLTRTGTDNPEIIADPDMIRINCSILPWTEAAEDEISF